MITKILVFAALLLGVFFLFKRKNNKSVENKEETVKAVEMKKDSVCGSYVEETTKYKVKLYDKIYYFCSEECKNKFIEENTNK